MFTIIIILIGLYVLGKIGGFSILSFIFKGLLGLLFTFVVILFGIYWLVTSLLF